MVSFPVGGVCHPQGKRPLGRPRSRWDDNIKIDLQEVGGGHGDWMELAQGRDGWRVLVGTVRNVRVLKMRGISWLAVQITVRFSRMTLLHVVNNEVLYLSAKIRGSFITSNHELDNHDFMCRPSMLNSVATVNFIRRFLSYLSVAIVPLWNALFISLCGC
jgi:hypothetical protein